MDGSLGHFKAILQRRKERKNKVDGKFDKKKLDYKSFGAKTEFNFPNLSKSEMERLKSEIRKKLKTDRLKDYGLFFLIVIALFSVLYYFIN